MDAKPAKKQTDPRALALVFLTILLIGAAVAVRLWANDQRLQVPNFKAMATAPDGRVFIVLGNTLHVESASGESLRIVPLAAWGVGEFHGDIAVLEDGSVILARGHLGTVGLDEGGRMFLRNRPSADDPVEGLMRCHPKTNECSLLDAGDEPVAFRRAFGMDVDRDNGLLYVSEPARHRIVQMTFDGRELAVSDQDWRFPNGVRVLENGNIAFADTNHHRYIELAAGPEGFGAIVREESILDWPGISELERIPDELPKALRGELTISRVPSEVLRDTNGTVWLLIAGSGMADAWLYRVPREGLPRQLPLPPMADPIALAQVQDDILVANLQHFRVHRFAADGEPREDFGSAELTQRLGELRRNHARYEALFEYSLLAVLAFAVPALGAGLYLQYKSPAGEAVEKEEEIGAASSSLRGFSSLEAQYAQLRGEFIFWRKFSVLGTQEAQRFGLLVGLLFAALIGSIVTLEMSIAERDGVSLADAMSEGELPRIGFVVAVLLLMAWMSAMFERLIITREGIRYVSMLPGPLGALNVFSPGWFHRWEDIASLRLVHMGKGRNQLMWRYEIITKQGKKRRIHPLSWRLAGEPEVGLPLRAAFRQKPAMIRDIIHRTWLFRLLGKQRDLAAGEQAADGAATIA